ncbi:uncharacterized protein MELLADRAFT_96148 [Melampsora larici-populina 98AG31]|uniref:Uncharacterized protein n=1 Tax=Melampsora larici-populina (strain 98AG31 / pathotype 3-4-7) TaxID=747676 RepID=F4SB51_MELLP|nr:uncharacterized protein MELLADRAFT_96148 [Melampsora larici-populina 98AG31]EGF98137.1 hypothetical protein MELLADRAFT_96148 [Melampsora larici-populina 98AG31]
MKNMLNASNGCEQILEESTFKRHSVITSFSSELEEEESYSRRLQTNCDLDPESNSRIKTPSLVLEGLIGHADPEHNQAKQWLQPRDNVVPPPLYPGTDTVYATKTVSVSPGRPRFTQTLGSPTVVVILQGHLPGPPQPSTAFNTITLDKYGHNVPFTTTKTLQVLRWPLLLS